MHKIANLWKFELNIGRRSCEIITEEKTPLSHEVVCFHIMLDFGPQMLFSGLEIKFKYLIESCSFLENYVTSEGAASHNVLYYQQLSIGH